MTDDKTKKLNKKDHEGVTFASDLPGFDDDETDNDFNESDNQQPITQNPAKKLPPARKNFQEGVTFASDLPGFDDQKEKPQQNSNQNTPLAENFQEGLGWKNEKRRRQKALQEGLKRSGQTFISQDEGKPANETPLPDDQAANGPQRLNEAQQQDAVGSLQERQQRQRAGQQAVAPRSGGDQAESQEETDEGEEGKSLEGDIANKIKGATPLSTIEILKAVLDVLTGRSDWKKFWKKMQDNQMGACACCSSCCCSAVNCITPFAIIFALILLLQGLL